MNDVNSLSHQVGTYSICPKVSEESILWGKARRNSRNHKDTMPMERSRNYRRGGVPRSYSSVVKYTSKNEYIRIYGRLKRGKKFNDISKIWEYEICVSE